MLRQQVEEGGGTSSSERDRRAHRRDAARTGKAAAGATRRDAGAAAADSAAVETGDLRRSGNTSTRVAASNAPPPPPEQQHRPKKKQRLVVAAEDEEVSGGDSAKATNLRVETMTDSEPAWKQQKEPKQQRQRRVSDAASATEEVRQHQTGSYNLRPTSSRKQLKQQKGASPSAATVTPAAHLFPEGAAEAEKTGRRIRFGEDENRHNAGINGLHSPSGNDEEEMEEASAANGSGVTDASTGVASAALPPGVVNIFDQRQQLLRRPSCRCPYDCSVLHDTALVQAHIATYGHEQLQSLRDREAKHRDRLIEKHYPIDEAQHLMGQKHRKSPSDLCKSERISSGGSIADSPRRGSKQAASSNAPRFPRLLDPSPHLPSYDDDSDDGDSDDDDSTNNNIVDWTDPLPCQPQLTPRMRSILINWLVEVSQEFKVSTRSIHMAISILDHLLWLGPASDDRDDEEGDPEDERFFYIDRNDFQACGCACLWIASKFEDKSPPSVDDLTYVADHSFTGGKLQALETRICRQLQFSLAIVTPMHFVNFFLRASHACPSLSCQFDHPVLRAVVMYLLELSRLSYDLSVSRPGLIAAAAVYLGRATVGLRETNPDHAVHPEGYWTKTLQYYTEFSLSELKNTVLHIYRFQITAERSNNFQGIFRKYRTAQHHFASMKPAVSSFFLVVTISLLLGSDQCFLVCSSSRLIFFHSLHNFHHSFIRSYGLKISGLQSTT